MALEMTQKAALAERGVGEDEDRDSAASAFSPVLPAWMALLRGAELPPALIKRYPRSVHRRVQRLAYDELMRAVMDACRNLDLALRLPSLAGGAATAAASVSSATPAATASETSALAALDRLGAASEAASAAAGVSAQPSEATADTEDAAADWPVLSLARNPEDMQARGGADQQRA